jgi:predicted transcriptional regulator
MPPPAETGLLSPVVVTRMIPRMQRRHVRNSPAPLHELDAHVMELVWELREVTVRSALEALNARADKPRAYTTVGTTLAHLHAKGLLTRRREQRAHIYAPVMSRDEYLRARAAADIRALVERYGDVALRGFLREIEQLDAEHRDRLQRLAGRDES